MIIFKFVSREEFKKMYPDVDEVAEDFDRDIVISDLNPFKRDDPENEVS